MTGAAARRVAGCSPMQPRWGGSVVIFFACDAFFGGALQALFEGARASARISNGGRAQQQQQQQQQQSRTWKVGEFWQLSEQPLFLEAPGCPLVAFSRAKH